MTKTIDVEYRIDDGYAQQGRTQSFKLNVEEFHEMEPDEIENLLYEYMHDDMLQHVHLVCNNMNDYVCQIIEANKERTE